jgi:hypothetical protein
MSEVLFHDINFNETVQSSSMRSTLLREFCIKLIRLGKKCRLRVMKPNSALSIVEVVVDRFFWLECCPIRTIIIRGKAIFNLSDYLV